MTAKSVTWRAAQRPEAGPAPAAAGDRAQRPEPPPQEAARAASSRPTASSTPPWTSSLPSMTKLGSTALEPSSATRLTTFRSVPSVWIMTSAPSLAGISTFVAMASGGGLGCDPSQTAPARKAAACAIRERRRRPALPGTDRGQRHDRGSEGLPGSGSDRPKPSPKPAGGLLRARRLPEPRRAGHHAGPRRHNRDSPPGARQARPKPAPPRPRVLRSHPHNAWSSSPEQDSNRFVAERSDPFFGVPVKSHQFDPDRSRPEVSVAPRRSGSSPCPA